MATAETKIERKKGRKDVCACGIYVDRLGI
jgi:hypothetical protein